MNIIKYIPNTLTLINVLSGCMGISHVFRGNLQYAEICFWVGIFFDFIDGFVARLLNSTSDIGKQLDSFGDMVTSGVLPSMFMFYAINVNNSYESFYFLKYFAFIYPAFVALRLSIFNLDTTQNHSFKGMPSPSGGLALVYLSIIALDSESKLFSKLPIFRNPVFLISSTILISLLLVSKLRFHALKFSPKQLIHNKSKLNFVNIIFGFLAFVIFLALIVVLKKEAVVIFILIYIILTFFNKKRIN